MQLIPDSWGARLLEAKGGNDCHNPKGSPEGGRFCGRRLKRRGPKTKTPPSPGTTEGVKYQQRRDNAIRSASQRRIINAIRKRDDTKNG